MDNNNSKLCCSRLNRKPRIKLKIVDDKLEPTNQKDDNIPSQISCELYNKNVDKVLVSLIKRYPYEYPVNKDISLFLLI